MSGMVRFGDRLLGEGQPCFIVFEAGPTHSGLASAKSLVEHAAAAKADAVKFQIIDPDRLVSDRKIPFEYEVLVDRETGRTEKVVEPLYDLLARRALSHDEWRELKALSDSLNLAFFATVGFDDEIALLEELGCDSIKVASGDVNHLPLIRKSARTGMCLQLDTGNATIGEIETAVDAIRMEGNDNIIIHQCPSGYPAHLESINLRIITTLKKMFPYPVAFSDHTPGWEMDIAAVAMGADLIEKTITEDRTTRSIEHVMSLEPQEMQTFVHAVRNLETAFGSDRRIMHQSELASRSRIRRSVHVAENVEVGQRLGDAEVEFRRPGDGIGPDRYEELGAMVFRRSLHAGDLVKLDDLASPSDEGTSG